MRCVIIKPIEFQPIHLHLTIETEEEKVALQNWCNQCAKGYGQQSVHRVLAMLLGEQLA